MWNIQKFKGLKLSSPDRTLILKERTARIAYRGFKPLKGLEEGEERGRNRIQYRNERPYVTLNNNHNNTRLMACFPGQPG